MSEATVDDYKQWIKCAATLLLLDEQLCTIASLKMTLEGALLKVGFYPEEINNNKYHYAVDRAKR